MAIVRIPGPLRQFWDTETGEVLGRREADRRLGRVIQSNEAKAKASKKANLTQALSRPARGRKAIKNIESEEGLKEISSRVHDFKLKTTRVKKVRPAALKTGHQAERFEFSTYEQYVSLLKQAQTERWHGKRLIVRVGLGFTGHDENHPEQRHDATIVTMQSPNIVMSQQEFEDTIIAYLEDHIYLVIDRFWLHMKFADDYIAYRESQGNKKRLKKAGITSVRKRKS